MSRETATFVMDTDGGRDAGKTFLLTEMSSRDGEGWALKVLSVLARSNVDLPENWTHMSQAAMYAMGFRVMAYLPVAEAIPLLDQLMDCVKIVVDPKQADATTRGLIEDDIEEIATRLRLKREVFDLHTRFFPKDGLSKLIQSMRSTEGTDQP